MTREARRLLRFAACGLALAVAACGRQPQEQGVRPADSSAETKRDAYQRVPDVFIALGLRPGAVVADIGAGRGYFTARLSAAVGPPGRVYAVDINPTQLDWLRDRAKTEHLSNVTVVEGAPADPHLSGASLDAVLVVDTYHEMTEQAAMLAAIRRALKPDGRLVMVDQLYARFANEPREQARSWHSFHSEWARGDLEDAGFSVIEVIPDFAIVAKGVTEWLIVAVPVR